MRVEVEGGGNVEVYSGSAMSVGGAPSPTIVAANVGHLYRLRVSGMERFPGVDIYPTVELIDRLHPPQGREDDFAIPIIITAADMQIAMSGQLVTRIIYLEQPQIAQMIDPLDGEIPQSVRAGDNALQEADWTTDGHHSTWRPKAIASVAPRFFWDRWSRAVSVGPFVH